MYALCLLLEKNSLYPEAFRLEGHPLLILAWPLPELHNKIIFSTSVFLFEWLVNLSPVDTFHKLLSKEHKWELDSALFYCSGSFSSEIQEWAESVTSGANLVGRLLVVFMVFCNLAAMCIYIIDVQSGNMRPLLCLALNVDMNMNIVSYKISIHNSIATCDNCINVWIGL